MQTTVLHVRLLGVPENAELIAQLCCRALREPGGRVELAGPHICATAAERQNPEVVLFRMRQCLLPAACGGWHLATDRDYAMYALAARLQQHDGPLDEPLWRLLQAHPVWPAITFIENVSWQALAQLLAQILDPRWFVDPVHPDRAARLRQYLGLTPSIQAAISADAIPRSDEAQRCRWTWRTWSIGGPPAEVNQSLPGNFLWRVQQAAGGGSRGDLRASQLFVAFLRHAWLDALEHRAGCRDGLFDAPRIFKREDELAAFKLHMSRFD